MRIQFVLTTSAFSGGMALATSRLAKAMIEAGHKCDVALPTSAGTAFGEVPTRTLDAIPREGQRLADGDRLCTQLAVDRPDLIVVADSRPDLLLAVARAAPTLLHCHLHWPACPDAGRYWNHFSCECRVKAGWKCLALRPVLGCGDRGRVASAKPVFDFRQLSKLLHSGTIGGIAVSAHQAGLMREHGVPNDALAVLPNLGMRLTIRELSDAASQTPTDERSRVVFLGRLSKPKGAQLLPDLANRLGADSLAVFGDGYLRTELQTSIGPALRGHLSQERVAGVLQWARAVVFPSLWPEPGGIVGIDAQLFGAPLGAFAVGSALDWPHAALFEPRDVRRLSEWASAQPDVTTARATEAIARAQTEYW